jgi:hypothetical protein
MEQQTGYEVIETSFDRICFFVSLVGSLLCLLELKLILIMWRVEAETPWDLPAFQFPFEARFDSKKRHLSAKAPGVLLFYRNQINGMIRIE